MLDRIDGLGPLSSAAIYFLNVMGELADLVNLGPKSEAMLTGAGITTLESLKQLGAVRAYAKVKASGCNASLNLLWALEGALCSVPWQKVAQERRLSLLLALESLEKGSS